MSRVSTLMLAGAQVLALAVLLSGPAQAKAHHHKNHVVRDKTQTYASVVTFSAKHHRHVSYRGGSCNGFDRCRCGTTAARNFGLAYDHAGMNLKLAAAWRGFQHTGFGVGVAAVRPDGHHVVKVVGGSSCQSAQVTDETGTYNRSICGWTFVMPGGGGFTVEATARTHSRRHHRQVYAEAFSPVEPQAIH